MLISARRLRPLSRSSPELLPHRRRSSPSARSGCPGTSIRDRSRSSMNSPKVRWVRSCATNCARRNQLGYAVSSGRNRETHNLAHRVLLIGCHIGKTSCVYLRRSDKRHTGYCTHDVGELRHELLFVIPIVVGL